ncbi:hypothetical protein [Butyricimonas paravirosa]
MNTKLLLVFGFSLSMFIACSKDGDKLDWEGYLETHEVILNAYAHDTLIKFNCEAVSGIRRVREVVGKDTTDYEFDYKLNLLQGDWFGLILFDDAVNIRTIGNLTGTERKLNIYFVFGGKGDYLNVCQKGAYESSNSI